MPMSHSRMGIGSPPVKMGAQRLAVQSVSRTRPPSLAASEEANAPLREFGLVGPDPENVLFNYVIHERISKSENFNLERIMRITVQRT